MSERDFDRIIDEQDDNLFEDENGSFLPTYVEVARWVKVMDDD